jgi:DNA-binding transcriptional ArsR family regulator
MSMPVSAMAATNTLARIGRALADATRRRLLLELLDGPRSSGDLAVVVDGSPSSTSNHLTCLRECGLVVAHPNGRRVVYGLANNELAGALRGLAALDLAATCDCHREVTP